MLRIIRGKTRYIVVLELRHSSTKVASFLRRWQAEAFVFAREIG